MDIDTFSNRCTPASTDLSICIWLCVFSIVYNYFNVGGRINIRMNTYGIFFVRNIRKRVAYRGLCTTGKFHAARLFSRRRVEKNRKAIEIGEDKYK